MVNYYYSLLARSLTLQDYYGQKRAEDLGHALIVIGFVSGTLVGFWKQSLLISLYFWLSGLGLTLLVS